MNRPQAALADHFVGLTPQYWPVFDLATGLIVGLDLVPPEVIEGPFAVPSRAWSGSVPALVGRAAWAVACLPGPAASWWVAVDLRHGQVAAPEVVRAVAGLLIESRLHPERLVIRCTEVELAHAERSGSARALVALGVRLGLVGEVDGTFDPVRLRTVGVSQVRIDIAALRSSGPVDASAEHLPASTAAMGPRLEAVAVEVETDHDLALAADRGIRLVRGFQFGSPGPLSKLIQTWG